MTDKEKLREALGLFSTAESFCDREGEVSDSDELRYRTIYEAAQAHLATPDAVSVDDAERTLEWIGYIEKLLLFDGSLDHIHAIKTIRTLLRAHAGVTNG